MVPGQNDDALFDNSSSASDCTYTGAMYPSVHSVTLDSHYTGTLHLDNLLSMGTLELDGGNIDQPNGNYSYLSVGNFNWSAGTLNVANNIAQFLATGTVNITGTNLATGDNLAFTGRAYARLNTFDFNGYGDGVARTGAVLGSPFPQILAESRLNRA